MKLVTRKGEDILAGYDSWGIRELRSNKLIWRSWGHSQHLEVDEYQPIGSDHGMRRVAADPHKLRMFFLSILWRAAATTLPEFEQIQVPDEHLQQLGRALLSDIPPPADFYPLMLTQLSTRGEPHNMAAVALDKRIPDLENGGSFVAPIFRLYFDGLIAHFHRPPLPELAVTEGPLVVGSGEYVVLSTVTFERSWQLENLAISEMETERDYPGELDQMLG